VGGFHTEYSSLRFAMFMLAEYINMVTVSALATTLFLGGWRAPVPLSLWSGANSGWWPVLWFVAKVWVFLFVFIWLRSTLPRLRYDQFMNFGWKILIPVALIWVMVIATVRVLGAGRYDVPLVTFVVSTIFAVVVLGSLLLVLRRRARTRNLPPAAPVAPFDAAAGGFPVPPIPKQGTNIASRHAGARSTVAASEKENADA
jgi:NADH-quinone oxidoreductase subunit H